MKAKTPSIREKRGASKDRSKVVPELRKAKRNLSNMPAAEVALLETDKPLTDKAKAFIKLWAQGESITSASIKAGYGDGASYAYKLVHLPQVKRLYEQEKRLYEEASQMTRKKVMDGLLDGIEMCRMNSDGVGVINGWKTVGQMCGYFEPVKRSVDVNVNLKGQLQNMSRMNDAELLQIIAQGAAAQLAAIEMTPAGDVDGDEE